MIEAPTLDLEPRHYRPVRPRLRLWLTRLRHPIYAFMAYQETHKDPPASKARRDAIVFAALVHGLVGWLLIQR